jgi:hypothetical protein
VLSYGGICPLSNGDGRHINCIHRKTMGCQEQTVTTAPAGHIQCSPIVWNYAILVKLLQVSTRPMTLRIGTLTVTQIPPLTI